MRRRTFLSIPLAAAAAPAAGRFTLGLYDLPKSPGALRQAAAAGFEILHVPATRAEYDRLRDAGLQGWSSLGSGDEARIRTVVRELRDHPALRFWETEDEPAYQWKKAGPRVTPERVLAAARAIRAEDPHHPLYLNHAPVNLESTLRQYNAAADIVAVDIYPVIPHGIREEYALWPDGRQGDLLNPTISQVGEYADKMRRVAGSGRAVFLVLQGFAWEKLRERDQDPRMVLYPTRAQTRFMAYQAIVHGVDGLLWWGLPYTPADHPLWSDLLDLARELRSLPLEAPARRPQMDIEYHETGHSLDRGIQWIAKGDRVIAVNADQNPVEVSIRALGVHEVFEPFGVRIWPQMDANGRK